MSRFVFFAIMFIGQFAQSDIVGQAHFSSTTLRPLVGEAFEISLTVTLESGSVITAWPDFSTQWADFEIENVGDLLINNDDSFVEYQQIFTARLWEPGDYVTPETVITYQPPNENVSVELAVNPSFFTVPSVLASGDEALAGLKAPVNMADFPPWLFVIILFFVFASVIVGLNTWQLRSRRRGAGHAESIDIRILGERALALLQKIDQTDPAAIYFLVDDRVRQYVRAYSDDVTLEMTTTEMLWTIQNTLPKPLFDRLQKLLIQADLVKFSVYQPDHAAAQRYLEAAVRWLQMMAREARETVENKGDLD